MKKLLLFLAIVLSTPIQLLLPANAQLFGGVVFDPQNFGQNVLTAARTLQQINNQVSQIQNEIRMLENQAKDLAQLPDSIADAIAERLFRIDELIRAARGITYEVERIEEQYEDLYPEDYGPTPPPTSIIVEEARTAWRQSREGYIHALQVQAGVVSNVRVDITELQGRLAASEAAEGNLSAMQAGNQIAALTAEQLMHMQEMMAAHYRAEALEQSRRLAEQERGRARFERFIGDGDAYTPGGGR